MSELIGRAIIIEHPYMYDRHLVALVTGQTAKTITVRYWDGHKLDWKREEARRKLHSSFLALPCDDAETAQAVHERLGELYQQHLDSQKAARQAYQDGVIALSKIEGWV